VVYANFESHEGTVAGAVTVPLRLRSRRVTITNDSASKNLLFKFHDGEDWGTLMPTETVSMNVWMRNVYLQGSSVPYRVWSIG